MRPSPVTARVLLGSCAGAGLVLSLIPGTAPVLAATGSAASAHYCDTADTHVMSGKPAVSALPGGAALDIYTHDGLKVSVVSVPAGSALHLHLWTSGAVTKAKQPTKVLASHRSGIAIMNADVFDASRGAIPQGVEITNGTVIKAEGTATNAVLMGANGKLGQGVVNVTGSVKAAGKQEPVSGLNWQDIAGKGINVYTSAWGSGSRPRGSEQVVVSGGRVASRGHDTGKRAKGSQQVLTGSGSAATFLSRLKPGEKVTVKTGFHAAFHYGETAFPVSDAVDHDTPFWLEGKQWQVDCSNSKNLEHLDRTGLGVTKNGAYFLMTTSGKGATASDLQYYLRQLGSYEADGFDNDTSATLAVRHSSGGKVQRVDKANNAYQRAVPNYLGIS